MHTWESLRPHVDQDPNPVADLLPQGQVLHLAFKANLASDPQSTGSPDTIKLRESV